jgi:RNA polymerase sigma-70 factor (ECF subfamily)
VSDPDAERMLEVRAGDGAAFTALVERWFGPLVGFFRRMGADASSAEDCAQEVFLKLFRTREAYEPRAKFTTYLFSIARNHWIDVYRHGRSAPPTVSSDRSTDGDEDEGPIKDRLEASGAAPERGAGSRETADALRAAVAALSDEHREVFALAQGEGMRYQEIALILRIPIGTVKSRMHTAMRCLRDALRRAGIEP